MNDECAEENYHKAVAINPKDLLAQKKLLKWDKDFKEIEQAHDKKNIGFARELCER